MTDTLGMETLVTVGGKIGEAVLSASVEALLGKLSSSDLVKYAREGQVLQEVKKWESMLKTINAVLDDAEERQMTSELVKTWVNELRDLTYDVEDILDEFATEALRRKLVKLSQPSPSKFRKFNPFWHASKKARTVKFNLKLGSKFEEITPRLQKIIAEKNDLQLKEGDGMRTKQVKERRPTTSLVNETKVHGREEDKKLILELLNAETSDTEVPGIISIVGLGGIGKTTLAQLIFNDASLEFDFKSWVFVGEDFDVFNITQTILQEEAKDLDSLQRKLKEKLCGKKFLIVLDDVWNENYDDWTLCRAPFEAAASGSKIIVTTRNQGVSSMMGSRQAYHLKGLTDEDCLSVFAWHALGAPDIGARLDLKEIGEAIVRRCRGMPLAAKSLGGLLRGKPNRYMWEQVLNNKIWDLPKEKSSILPALRISYHHLPSHLKRCFVYCAIFPKGYEFDKIELVLLWMAEGFLHKPNGKKHLEDLGSEYFDELLSRSFFQQSTNSDSKHTMHDLINDLAQSISGETCFCLEDTLEEERSYAKVRHSSFTCRRFETSQRFEVFHQMSNLRTFLALPDPWSWHNYLTSKVPHDLLPKLKYLTVLSLASYRLVDLPNSIGDLKHLRYLNLSHTEIKRLPESVTELFNLLTLSLHGCGKLIELPRGICNLINLQYLDIRKTDNLQQMPPHIGNLANLRFLPKYVVDKGTAVGIMELMKLSSLRCQLHILGLHNVKIRDVELANLGEKKGLEELTLEWIDSFNDSRNDRDELQVLTLLEPHQRLEALSIISYGGLLFPSWIGDPSFSNLASLQLQNCRKTTSLPSLGQLPSLRHLSIEGMDKVKEVGPEFCGDASSPGNSFSALEALHIKDMLGWEKWSWSNDLDEDVKGEFPGLQELTLVNCPKLFGKLPSRLPSLKKLEIRHCLLLAELPDRMPATCVMELEGCHQMALQCALAVNPSTLIIENVSGLINLPDMVVHASVVLEDLMISYCNELKYLWRDGTNLDKLSNLKHLRIFECEQLLSLTEGDEGLWPCNLETLTIEGCTNLDKLPNGLPNLASLEGLRIERCPKLVSLSTTCFPQGLKFLYVVGCDSLRFLPLVFWQDGNDNKKASHLENLRVGGCPHLSSFSTNEFPHSLRSLGTCYCTTQLLGSLKSGLTSLHITDSPLLESFPDNGLRISTLTYLRISRCVNLKSLPKHMQNLTALQSIEIKDCPSLRSFPEGGLPPSVTSLTIRDCENRTQPMSEWGLHRLTSLKWLLISGTGPSTNMVSFPDDDGLLLPTSITTLCIERLENLNAISMGIRKLTSLQEIHIRDCPKLQSLPKEGFPAALKSLRILSCPLLRERCAKEKGEYWPIIAHIPGIHLDCFPFTRQLITL